MVDAKTGLIQVTANLVIKNFADMMAGFLPGRHILSDPFNVGHTPMAIKVFPNGQDDEEKGTVAIFLQNRGTTGISVKCQLITDLMTRKLVRNFDYTNTVDAGSSFGFSRFLTHATCAEIYKEKDFIVTAKVEVPGKPVKIAGIESGPPPKKKKLNVLENIYNTMEKSDFILVFGGVEVACHKIVLAAASPVLKAMVENKHRESIEGKANIEFSGEVGQAVVRFIYTGEVQKGLLKEHASAFLAMGELYDLLELKDMAETELLSQLDKKNMIEMISIGDFFRAENIFEAALRMTKANMAWKQSQVA